MKHILFLSSLLFVTACHTTNKEPRKHILNMRNPASVYCNSLQGQHIPIYTPQGQHADCQLPNGDRINEWDLYRRDHKN